MKDGKGADDKRQGGPAREEQPGEFAAEKKEDQLNKNHHGKKML